MSITVEAGRHSAQAGAEHSCLHPRAQGEENYLGILKAFEISLPI